MSPHVALITRSPIHLVASVSLKTKLSSADLHRLVCDVRRRVEYEVTFEGKERRIKYVLPFRCSDLPCAWDCNVLGLAYSYCVDL